MSIPEPIPEPIPDVGVPSNYTPLALGDIISIGLGKLAHSLLPVIIMALAPAVALAFLKVEDMPNITALKTSTGFHYMTLFRFYEQHAVSIVLTLSLSLLLLSYYPLVLFAIAKDVYEEKPLQSFIHYLTPRSFYAGLFTINFIYGLGGLMLSLVVLSGFLLFLLPGFMALGAALYLLTRFMLSPTVYVMEPEQGIGHAFKTSWSLTENHFWRTQGLTFALGLIVLLAVFPFNMLSGIVQIAIRFAIPMTALTLPLWVHIALMVIATLSFTFILVFGKGASTFVTLRYYFDLKARKNGSAENTAGWRSKANM